jgi:hypothetical protein
MILSKGLNMNSIDEFLKAIQSLPQPKNIELEYRVHYDNEGNIFMCSMQQHPDNTQYIVVSKNEYDNYFRYKVVNNQLKMIDNATGYRVKLTSSTQGYRVVKNHAGIILEPNEQYLTVEYYAAN